MRISVSSSFADVAVELGPIPAKTSSPKSGKYWSTIAEYCVKKCVVSWQLSRVYSRVPIAKNGSRFQAKMMSEVESFGTQLKALLVSMSKPAVWKMPL